VHLTDREQEILEVLRRGVHNPTLLARELGITQSGATQALQKLETKGAVTRSKVGRHVFYRPVEEERKVVQLERDLEVIRQSYHALSRVWGHVLSLDLTEEELAKVREARNLLEEILASRGKKPA